MTATAGGFVGALDTKRLLSGVGCGARPRLGEAGRAPGAPRAGSASESPPDWSSGGAQRRHCAPGCGRTAGVAARPRPLRLHLANLGTHGQYTINLLHLTHTSN